MRLTSKVLNVYSEYLYINTIVDCWLAGLSQIQTLDIETIDRILNNAMEYGKGSIHYVPGWKRLVDSQQELLTQKSVLDSMKAHQSYI